MTQIDTPDIDARGLKCPLPVLRLAKDLRSRAEGAIVSIWADDPMAMVDIPHFCHEAGHVLRSQSDTGPYQIYVIARGPDRAAP